MPPHRDSSNGRLNKHLPINPICQAVRPRGASVAGTVAGGADALCDSTCWRLQVEPRHVPLWLPP